jgi:hypothetical protein
MVDIAYSSGMPKGLQQLQGEDGRRLLDLYEWTGSSVVLRGKEGH